MPYLPEKEFKKIYATVPRLAVDVCIKSEQGYLLAKRSIDPYIGCWHMPGGTLYKNESLYECAKRIALSETGLVIVPEAVLGSMEFFQEKRNGIIMHTVSIVILAKAVDGETKHDQHSSDLCWFNSLPRPMVAEHQDFLESMSKKIPESF